MTDAFTNPARASGCETLATKASAAGQVLHSSARDVALRKTSFFHACLLGAVVLASVLLVRAWLQAAKASPAQSNERAAVDERAPATAGCKG